MFEKELSALIEETLKKKGFEGASIKSCHTVSGGSINETYLLRTTKGKFFVKLNDKSRFPKMFQLEEEGLEQLRESEALRIPKVIAIAEGKEKALLLMEFIEEGSYSDAFWNNFGHGLASLHQNTNAFFGLGYDNYIGSLQQPNSKTKSWAEFFVVNRLAYQAKMAFDQGLLDQYIMGKLESLYSKLDEIFPNETPALLHGDLWSGNFLIDQSQEAVLVDPAVYYGHREIDIAMTHLFGGFKPAFYNAYQEVYPLDKGWESRIELCNLYPLLVHVNLFGGGYASRVKSVLKRF